jgi:hypothetical protein
VDKIPVGEERIKERVKKGEFVYENRTMKLVETILSRGEKGDERMMEGVNLIKTYCKHICKCHNVSPCTTIICKKRKNENENKAAI